LETGGFEEFFTSKKGLIIRKLSISSYFIIFLGPRDESIIELDDGKIYRKALYLMVKTMVSCRFSLKPIQ